MPLLLLLALSLSLAQDTPTPEPDLVDLADRIEQLAEDLDDLKDTLVESRCEESDMDPCVILVDDPDRVVGPMPNPAPELDTEESDDARDTADHSHSG